jgi:hypothetical protein
MRLALALIALLMCGCVAKSPLTPEGRMVRQIQPDWANRGTFLGSVQVQADCEQRLLNRLRNKIAEMGGNAYVINDRSAGKWFMRLDADAYKIPDGPMEP